MDEGWTRYVFDDMGVPYKTLHNADIKGTKEKKADLRAEYDVIVFADENANTIKGTRPGAGTGGAAAESPMARMSRQATCRPSTRGASARKASTPSRPSSRRAASWSRSTAPAEFAISDFGPPARNALTGVDRTKFFCPTSILRIIVDNETPIGYGLPKEAAAMFVSSLAFDTNSPPYDWDRKVVAAYPKDEILLSGWLLGEEYLSRKAAVVDTKWKDGRIILIGVRCQNRAQSHGTYKFLLNALLYPGM